MGAKQSKQIPNRKSFITYSPLLSYLSQLAPPLPPEPPDLYEPTDL